MQCTTATDWLGLSLFASGKLQMFRMVNSLLKSDREARLRKLQIRTYRSVICVESMLSIYVASLFFCAYRVVPLHATAGVVEWVRNAIPLGNETSLKADIAFC